MLNNSKLRNLTTKTSTLFEPHILIYTPDEQTQLFNDDGSPPFVKEFSVSSDRGLVLDPNWETTTIGYKVVLVTSNKPVTTDFYWVEINNEKKPVNFGRYETKYYGFLLLLKGD